MALTDFQSRVLKSIAANRLISGESYVAGGLALNHGLRTPRISRDIDIFHDTFSALEESSARDMETLSSTGYSVRILRRQTTFIEAEVVSGNDKCEIQWAVDSAYRFFPLVADDVTGLTLHPFDLATNKVLALVGRLEPRDWIDAIACTKTLQPLPYLVSAACGKDPGFSPLSVLELLARRRYNQCEIDANISPRGIYNAAELCAYWHEMVGSARESVRMIPAGQVGKAIMTKDGKLFTGDAEDLRTAISRNDIIFHEGAIGGAWPTIIG